MAYRVKNVSLEPAGAMKRRQAPRLEMEPVIAGQRVRLHQTISITNEQFAINKERIEQWERFGVLSVVGAEGEAPAKAPEPAKEATPPPLPLEPAPDPEPEPEPELAPEPEPETEPAAAPAAPVATKAKKNKGKRSKKS